MLHADYQLALELQHELNRSNADVYFAKEIQKEFDHEYLTEKSAKDLYYSDKKNKNKDQTKSLVDPSWEIIDPTPDIHNLFMAFDKQFFWNKLVTVCVDWSKRMTTCAGVCSYSGRREGMCKITLSEPLLKLRPRKDLVETLLHEMIHAYLFVTHNNKDRDGHGPEFHKHMYRINAEAGTNITVYHDFHDEVRLYQQHWWKCDGPCQFRKPFYGIVRRATNRAPGPNDFWWQEHSVTCGGSFIKIKEPEKISKPKKEKKEILPKDTKSDIRNYLIKTGSEKENVCGKGCPGPQNHLIKTGSEKKNVCDKGRSGPRSSMEKENAKNSKILSNVYNLHFVISSPKTTDKVKQLNTNSTIVKSSQINNLATCDTKKKSPVTCTQTSATNSDYDVVRNHWINKFSNSELKTNKRHMTNETDLSAKKPKTTTNLELNYIYCPNCDIKCLESKINSHLDICLISYKRVPMTTCDICNAKIEKTNLVKHMQDCLMNL